MRDREVNYTPRYLHDSLSQVNENIRTIKKSRTWKGRTLYDLEMSDVDKATMNSWLKFGDLLPETTAYDTEPGPSY